MKIERIPKDEWKAGSYSGRMVENLAQNTTGPRLMLDVDANGIRIKPEKPKDEKKSPPGEWSYRMVDSAFGKDKSLVIVVKGDGQDRITRTFTLQDKDRQAGKNVAYQIEMNRCLDWYQNQDAETQARVQLVKCPQCQFPFNIGPAVDSQIIQCPTCQKLLHNKGETYPLEENEEVCPKCGAYTKLQTQTLVKEQIVVTAQQQFTGCFGCARAEAFKSFLWSILSAAGIIVLNVLTVVFLNRYFPVLLLIGAIIFLYSLAVLVKFLLQTAAKGFGAVSPLERVGSLIRTKKFKEAENTIFELEQKGATMAANYNRALISFLSNEAVAAISYLKGVLKTCPNHISAIKLALIIFSTKHMDGDLEDFREEYLRSVREINCAWAEA